MRKFFTQPLICAALIGTASCVVEQDEQSFATDSPDPGLNESIRPDGIEGETDLREEYETDWTQPYDSVVNHYSNHWPSQYHIYLPFPSAGAGVHFYARWKWYQGYGSRTVCMIANDCGVPLACAQDFDLRYGACTYVFNVDGPYQMQAKVGWFSSDTFSDWWTY